jgi:hypothetical protein
MHDRSLQVEPADKLGPLISHERRTPPRRCHERRRYPKLTSSATHISRWRLQRHSLMPQLRREALCYIPAQPEELEGRFLGLMADLDPKGKGDNSMPGK